MKGHVSVTKTLHNGSRDGCHWWNVLQWRYVRPETTLRVYAGGLNPIIKVRLNREIFRW